MAQSKASLVLGRLDESQCNILEQVCIPLVESSGLFLMRVLVGWSVE